MELPAVVRIGRHRISIGRRRERGGRDGLGVKHSGMEPNGPRGVVGLRLAVEVNQMLKSSVIVIVAGLTLAGCATPEQEGALFGGAAGAAIGGLATNSVGGAVAGGAIGALAGAVLVRSQAGWCTYHYRGRHYRERCR
jgi:hypothetical protein